GGITDLALGRVQRLLLEEDHRVGVPDRGGEQPGHVVGVGGGHHLPAGHGHRPVLPPLRVLRTHPDPGPVGGPDHQRERDLAVRHVPALGDLVGHQVPAHGEEVAEHDLGDRAQAGHGGAHGGTEDGLLADRRVPHPPRAELLQQADGGLEHPARRRHVLAEEHYPVIAPHLLRDPPGDRLAVGDDAHVITASTVPAGTVSSAATLISASVPLAGAGMSVSTLSVPISSSGSPSVTWSPCALCQTLTVPSSTVSPIRGITTSVLT